MIRIGAQNSLEKVPLGGNISPAICEQAKQMQGLDVVFVLAQYLPALPFDFRQLPGAEGVFRA